jgi:LAO/AO transport system kinase
MVETVGVGQSETAVHSIVDFFLLLMLAGSGDELQGIKRGIMEIADMIVITKADGSNKLIAEGARMSFQNALRLMPSKASKWDPQVLTCSALENSGILELWEVILEYFRLTQSSGYFKELRKQQAVLRMHSTVIEYLNSAFYDDEDVKSNIQELEKQLYEGKITSYKAASILLDKYFKR